MISLTAVWAATTGHPEAAVLLAVAEEKHLFRPDSSSSRKCESTSSALGFPCRAPWWSTLTLPGEL